MQCCQGVQTAGGDPVVTGWVGGFADRFIEDGLRRKGIRTNFIHADFESRTCLSIIDPENGTLTELYETGDPISQDRLEELTRLIRSTVQSYSAVTLSCSLPPGIPPTMTPV